MQAQGTKHESANLSDCRGGEEAAPQQLEIRGLLDLAAEEWRRRRKLHLEQKLRHALFLANLRDNNVKRVRDMSAEEQRVLEDHDNGKLRKRYDDVRIRKPE